jgi:hypothetical protein
MGYTFELVPYVTWLRNEFDYIVRTMYWKSSKNDFAGGFLNVFSKTAPNPYNSATGVFNNYKTQYVYHRITS